MRTAEYKSPSSHDMMSDQEEIIYAIVTCVVLDEMGLTSSSYNTSTSVDLQDPG